MFTEVASLLNYRAERTVILNDITQDNNKVLGYDRNKTVKLNRVYRSMEEDVSTFKSVVGAEQRNGGPHQKRPLSENKNLTRSGWINPPRDRKDFKANPYP